MNNAKSNLDNCGCCDGVEFLTPSTIYNDHGLVDLLYRVGTHGRFKESMIRGLADSALLKELTIRENNDSTIALMDVWAMILDILTFYNERIINEGYILTAKERLSLVELARHINYIPKPGVAAGSWFAFLTDESPGAPTEAKVPIGTRVQSIPGQDEKAQIFETIEEIIIKTKWNAIKPKLTNVQSFLKGANKLYLKGTNNQLQKGDKILMVGTDRIANPESEKWDFRTIANVNLNNQEDYTEVIWREGLGHDDPTVYPSNNTKVYVFRQRAALFGYNAPDYKTMSEEVKESFNGSGWESDDDWAGFEITASSPSTIDLDAHYPKILPDSWVVLTQPTYVELYRATKVQAAAQKDFVLATKSSKLFLDTNENLTEFQRRETVVWTESEELPLAQKPILDPIFGNSIELNQTYPELKKGNQFIISGELVKYLIVTPREKVIKSGSTEVIQTRNLYFFFNEGNAFAALKNGEKLEIIKSPISNPKPNDANITRWFVSRDETEGYVDIENGLEDLIPFKEEKLAVAEIPTSLNQPIIVSELIEVEKNESNVLVLKEPLKNVYFRSKVHINANIAQATHGETKSEILGSGNGAVPFQKFYLKQKPLTYISATTASGIATSLEIRVNEIKWKEVPTFFNKGSEERIFISRTEDDGTTYVQFGNGITGARLPSGSENIRATYRVGIGLEGLLKTKQLSLLMNPQLGIKSVSNPLLTSGAENPETLKNIRKNAPLTILTLDRIVSIEDYENFANAFAGIGKARVDILWKGEDRTIHLTLASADGGELGVTVKENLIRAIDNARHDNYRVVVNSFEPNDFNIIARIKIHSDFIESKVIEAVKNTLLTQYNFDSRTFGQGVAPSEIIAIIQSVNGVVAVDLDELGGQDPNAVGVEHYKLVSQIARWENNIIKPAELLLIDEDNIELTSID